MSDLQSTKKSASESIQIDEFVSKTPNVHGDSNQETRTASVQLNIVEDGENMASDPCCTLTEYPKLCQILNWIWGILKGIWEILKLIGFIFKLILLGLILMGSFMGICACFDLAYRSDYAISWIPAIFLFAVYMATLVVIPWGKIMNFCF